MSAIFGMISLDGKKIRREASNDFKRAYGECRIDRFAEQIEEDAYIGCGLQYITKESCQEILPIRDEEQHKLFTADCILDNREALLQELEIADEATPDGTLLYRAYLKWGKDCVSHLRGMFSFAVYDRLTKEVTLAADQFATRCLFYHVRDNVVYFSTMLMPMIEASGLSYRLNQSWLADSISVLSPAVMFETRQCAYEDVYKVDCGNMVHISGDGKPVYERYYDPRKTVKTDNTMTEERCKQELYETLFQSVKNCIRTSGETGIQLSSGLDSSTIGCIAAPFLKEEGRSLYSYTSIPSPDFPRKEKSYQVDDESEGVKKIAAAYPNIVPAFVDCAGMNILKRGEDIVKAWELPCQSEQNAVWVEEIFRRAAEDGCRIMLSGATGNCTVSAGSMLDALYDLCIHGHPITGLKNYKAFCRKYRINAKKLLKITLKDYVDYVGLKLRLKKYPYREYILTKPELLKQVEFEKRVVRPQLNAKPWKTMKRHRFEVYLENAYAQIGEIDTKISLKYGVIPRDPLRNVEFIDFIMKLPMKFFANENYDRRLVREFMQGIVPTEICVDFAHRGRQSGDNAFRIAKDWEEYKPIIEAKLLSKTGLSYFDEETIHQKLDHLTKDNLTEHELDARICIDSALFVSYVDRLSQFTEKQ